MKVPEEWIPRVRQLGWTVLIRDSEMPYSGDTFTERNLHMNPRRYWDNPTGSDWWDEEDGA